MSANNILIEWKKRNPNIKNFVLFISDSLRWDLTPKTVSDLGVMFKTVASSIYTPPSFASIITGLYPHNHGIYSFLKNQLPNEMDTLLNLRSYNTSLWTENTWIGLNGSSPLHEVLSCKKHISLDKIEPPFIYIEDEKGGHCPYGWSNDEKEYEEWDCISFFRDIGKKGIKELHEKYKKGIDRSVKIFNKRLDTINKRGLQDDTLIIFLSDHGEILGEYGGLVGHGNVTVPEVVYVPVIFIHPNLPKNLNFSKEGVLRHVDIFPTICDMISFDIKMKIDGISLFKCSKLPYVGYCYFLTKKTSKKLLSRLLNYYIIEYSIWDKDGGYVFRKGNISKILFRAIYHTILSNSCLTSVYKREQIKKTKLPHFIINYCKSIKTFLNSTNKYGMPSINYEIEFARANATKN